MYSESVTLLMLQCLLHLQYHVLGSVFHSPVVLALFAGLHRGIMPQHYTVRLYCQTALLPVCPPSSVSVCLVASSCVSSQRVLIVLGLLLSSVVALASRWEVFVYPPTFPIHSPFCRLLALFLLPTGCVVITYRRRPLVVLETTCSVL